VQEFLKAGSPESSKSADAPKAAVKE
jgi:hypothetical protein